ncbi:C39 family peptidase, partial [Phytoactinopolyspora endophytica]|uniref:C39 family peptidase n=1 Tax=Phytoactinopolyspora endophytica TaxID=1642495 RepID=UPI00197B9DB0
MSAAELETSGAADREAALGEVDFARWGTNADWLDGDRSGVAVLPGQRTGIMMIRPVGTSDDVDVVGGPGTWEYATWTSPVTELPFDATELIASWGASTPGDSWISVEAQGTYDDGSTTPWYVLGNWDAHDNGIERASVDGQGDEHSRVLVDTFAIGDTDVVGGEDDGASSEPGPRDAETPADDEPGDRLLLSAYQLRVTMYRPQGSLVMPRVWMLGAMASSIPERFSVPPSDGGIASGEELNVPRRSKNVHRESHPEYGGGASWSNPAATTMVMEYFGAVPSRDDMAWIDAGYTDPQVAHAARMTWDNLLEGTGNWSFNTAYAATFPEVDAFVTRLRSLDDVERF